MQRIGGFRRKTRHKLSKNVRYKGKISLSKYFQVFKEGEKVCLVSEPAIQKGMYYPRFYGKAGTIIGKRGRCYEVKIKDGSLTKLLLVHAVHMQKL